MITEEDLMEKNLHFIGIGGIGMSAIARIMLHQGFNISGSDVKESRLTQELIKNGAHVAYGHAGENIPAGAEAIVYSSAVKPDNPEMREAVGRGLKIYKRAEALAYLMSTYISVGVAGAHGKTTTSAMISTMLESAGCDPTIVIGGMLDSIGGNAKAGDGKYLIAEADESDGTFLVLYPTVAVVTNIEADHLDHYENLDNIITAFAQYFRQIPEDGFSVYCADCPICRRLAAEVPGRYISYAINEPADYTAKNILQEQKGVSADIYCHDEKLGRLELAVPGVHNIANGLAAVAVGREFGLDFATCAKGLAEFHGTGRRFEKMGEFDGLTVIDDYAHHPTEIARTIEAARGQGVKDLTVVFQPHRYSRTQSMYAEFAAALMDADRVVLCELYPAFEKPIDGVSAKLIMDEMCRLGHKSVTYAADVDATLELLKAEIADEDMLLVMGAGNIRSVSERYAQYRREQRNG